MPRYPGFVGPTYASQSPTADPESAINWYVEQMESLTAKVALTLYPCPGTTLFATMTEGPVRQLFFENGRCFAVAGSRFVEIFSDGTFTDYGSVANDGLPASICSSSKELFIVSGGYGYRKSLTDSSFDPISSGGFPRGQAFMGTFLDGYFIVLQNDSRTFAISELYDATTWGALEFSTSSFGSDMFLSMVEDHGELWLFGTKTTQPYYDSGDSDFPFTPNLTARIEQGIIAKDSVVKLDNTLFWLGGDQRGAGIAWRAQGYTPARVSNHAVEYALQKYPRLDDAVGYSYQDQGHGFYVLRFPSANATWVYDVVTNLWHQRGWWNTNTGQYEAHHSQNHAYAFGKHLVGDWASGKIYDMSIAYGDDAGNPIRRVRRAPAVFMENKRIRIHSFEVYLESGLGLDGGPTVQGSDPQVMLRVSKDSGRTWGNELTRSAGKIGENTKRVIFRRLGQARSFVPEVAVSDPIPWRLVDAFYNPEAGLS